MRIWWAGFVLQAFKLATVAGLVVAAVRSLVAHDWIMAWLALWFAGGVWHLVQIDGSE